MNDVELQYPVNSLVSFYYFRKSNISQIANWGLRLIGDSGAYSAASLGAAVDVNEFAEWAACWRDSLYWIASLDEIGDPAGSWRNYEHLRGKGLDVVPTIHFGSSPSEIDRYVSDGVDFMGLGGLVSSDQSIEPLLAWCLSMFRYARDNHPQVRFHGWGVTHAKVIQSLPWYSVDSSSFSAAYRYGNMRLFDPRRAKFTTVKMNGQDAFRHGGLLRESYGIEPSRIAVSNKETMRDVTRVSLKALQLMEAHLAARFGEITPPTYGIRSAESGLLMHGVDSAAPNLRLLGKGNNSGAC